DFIPFFRRMAVPSNRERVILRHAAAVLIHPAKIVECGCVILLCRTAIPEDGFCVIGLDAAAFLKPPADVVLRRRIASFGPAMIKAKRLVVILAHTEAILIHPAEI